jgi:hypothetical protein
MTDSYDQKDAAGFIRILGLPSRSRAMAEAEKHSALSNANGSHPAQTKGKQKVSR